MENQSGMQGKVYDGKSLKTVSGTDGGVWTMTRIDPTFRRKAASTVFHLATRTQESGLERNISAPPKEGWVMGGTGLYCLPEKIYEALQYYEIANEIHPSATFLNLKALALETLLDFPAALQAYKDLEEWGKANEEDGSACIEAARLGQMRCRWKPKGDFGSFSEINKNEKTMRFPDQNLETHDTEKEEQKVDEVAIKFVTALTQRDYALAYSMTTQDFRKRASLRDLQEQFEYSCPPDYGEFDFPDILSTMDEWPAKTHNDIRSIYITIGGEHSEAVTVVVAYEGNDFRISDVEVGRP